MYIYIYIYEQAFQLYRICVLWFYGSNACHKHANVKRLCFCTTLGTNPELQMWEKVAYTNP